jgi:CubicO group peptidase (beta-lactamase class C family)
MNQVTRLLLFGFFAISFANIAQGQQTNYVASNDTMKAIDAYLSKLALEKNFCGGLLIVRGTTKMLSKGYGWANREKKIPFTPGTLASMGSITKAFTAAAVLKLVEQGKLQVTDSLKKFFPTVPQDKAAITLHQLLTHSSGFPQYLKNDGGDFAVIKTPDFVTRMFADPLVFKPGSKAIYSNIGMSLLAIIVEKVSGVEYEAFLKKKLFEPIGIKHLSYAYPPAALDTIAQGYEQGNIWGTHQERFKKFGNGVYWNLKGNGGLEVSLNELFLWVNAITNFKVLNAQSVQKMFSPLVQEEGYGGRSFFGYGCNVQQSRRNTKMIDNGGSNGIFHARLIRLPEENLIFYLVTTDNTLSADRVMPNISQLFFQGKIVDDALAKEKSWESPLAEKIHRWIVIDQVTDLGAALKKANLEVDDDMILLEVGQKLMTEKKLQNALTLYNYYTQIFPNIVVAWNDIGDVYRNLNNKEKAIVCYQQALKIRPENPRAKKNLQELSK